MISRAESVMGTVVSFLVDCPDWDPSKVHVAIDAACEELHRLDERFSAWQSESELSKMRAGEVEATSPLMDEVLELCAEAYDASHGFFDAWAMPGGFDPTGLVKGWAAQRAVAVLADRGVEAALVNAGGDICVLPSRRYLVGIRHPTQVDALCGVVPISSAIATSGVYERGQHLLNPFGGEIAAISATVVGDRLVLCDAMATALAVGGRDVLYLIEHTDSMEGFFITAEGAMFATSGMPFDNEGASPI